MKNARTATRLIRERFACYLLPVKHYKKKQKFSFKKCLFEFMCLPFYVTVAVIVSNSMITIITVITAPVVVK